MAAAAASADNERLLSLNLRPAAGRNGQQVHTESRQPPAGSRLPLPMTEIEPHFSRDNSNCLESRHVYRKLVNPEDEAVADGKFNKAEVKVQDRFNVDDEDFTDLISAISLGISPPSRYLN